MGGLIAESGPSVHGVLAGAELRRMAFSEPAVRWRTGEVHGVETSRREVVAGAFSCGSGGGVRLEDLLPAGLVSVAATGGRR